MSLVLSTNEERSQASEAAAPQPVAHRPEAPARRWLLAGLGVVAVVVLGGAGVYFKDPLLAVVSKPAPTIAPPPADPVAVAGPGLISVTAGTALEKRLQIERVQREDLDYPLLNVTGHVMARLAPGKDQAESRWDFATPEVASAYADWLNASRDVAVLTARLEKTRAMVKEHVGFLKADWENKKKYADTLPKRDVEMAGTEYRKADIQGDTDIFNVHAELKKADRNRGLYERQLLQAGVDPEVISKATEGMVLVVADVPEAKIGMVKPRQACEATFYGVPDKADPYTGKVGRLGPSVAKEKRTLRVTFELPNPDHRLVPGMFGEIGLGTESRNVLTVPAEAVLHAGKSDYVLMEDTAGKFRVVEVKADEPRQIKGSSRTVIPIADGPLNKDGRVDRVIGAGAILLKPIMVKALAAGHGASH